MKLIFFFFLILSLPVTARNPVIMSFLDKVPAGCEVTITSGYRSKEHNRKVGGATKSLHLTDRAIDAIISCRCWIIKSAKDYGITIILYNNYIHLDIRTKCMVKLLRGGYRFC